MDDCWRPAWQSGAGQPIGWVGRRSDVMSPMVDLGLSRSGDRAVVIWAAVAGILADLAVRSGGGLSAALLAVAVGGMFLVWSRPSGWQPWAIIGAACLFASFLAVRASPWLLPLDLLAAGGLLLLAASLTSGGSLVDLPVTGLLSRAVHAAAHGLAGPAFAGQGLRCFRPRHRSAGDPAPRTDRPSWPSVLRGVAMAGPLLVVLGALLASSDVLFAHAFDFAPDVEDLTGHVVLLGLGAWGMAGLLRVGAATPPASLPERFPLFGAVEATIVVGSVNVLFLAFAVTQVVALAGGGRHVVETAGLTYAEYARTGFFQLVAVAAITLVVLVAVDVLTDRPAGPGRRRLLALSELCIGLTVVVVVSALRRLDLYENTYGLTMLRLYVAVFVAWIGITLVLLGVWLLGRQRAWLPIAAVGAGLTVLLALNLVNPEALVVRRNVALAERTGRFDPSYVAQLSDDALPEIVRVLPRLPPTAQADLVADVCSRPRTATEGWAAWNASDRTAAGIRRQLCPGR